MFIILYYTDCNLRKMTSFDKNKKVICNHKNNCSQRSMIYIFFSSLIFPVQSMCMCYFQNHKKGSKNAISWRKSYLLAPSFSVWILYETLSHLLCPLNASLFAALLDKGAPVGPPLTTGLSHFTISPAWPVWVPFPLALFTGWVVFHYPFSRGHLNSPPAINDDEKGWL